MLSPNPIDTNNKSISDYKDICNAFGCFNPSTETIDVNAGSFGKITLFVCKSCISRFQNKGVVST